MLGTQCHLQHVLFVPDLDHYCVKVIVKDKNVFFVVFYSVNIKLLVLGWAKNSHCEALVEYQESLFN